VAGTDILGFGENFGDCKSKMVSREDLWERMVVGMKGIVGVGI
jgi:hypothetical protein